MSIPINFITWICAALPILAILILMVGFNWSASKAGPIGWFVAIIVAIMVFKADIHLLANSNSKGFVMAFYVLYIIWGALLLYHIVNEVGGIECIGATFIEMTHNKVLQLLMIGFSFVTFLQGVAGFGVPVAVGAPLLVGLGFPPTTAVATALIGHAWAVTFGDMAASFAAIQKVTGLAGADLAPWTALFISIAGILCAFFVMHCYGNIKAIKHGFIPTAVVGGAMSLSLFVIAQWEPTLATFLSGIIGMIVTGLLCRVSAFNTDKAIADTDFISGDDAYIGDHTGVAMTKKMGFNMGFAAYYVLIAIVMVVSFVPGLKNTLKNLLVLELHFDEYTTGYGWVTAAGPSSAVGIFSHAGALLLYASVIGIVIYSIAGYWKSDFLPAVMRRVVKNGINSSIATSSMVLMAFIMVESGMTFTLAKGVATVLGAIYPVLAPSIGVLGAFMTGSNTNSNVMFGAFQTQMAELLGASPLIMAAAQTAGGSIGSMLAPAKVIVGTSTVGLTGREGDVIGKTLKYCIFIALILGAITLALVFTK